MSDNDRLDSFLASANARLWPTDNRRVR